MTYLTKEELEADLDRKLAEGKITPAEAEDIWQEWMHKGMDSRDSIYGF